MTLIETIKATPAALTAAQAGDFVACRDAVRAIRITASHIDLGEMLYLMNFRGMLVRLIRPTDSGEKWAGTLVNMVLAEGTPANLQLTLQQFFSHITNDRNSTFQSNTAEFGGLFATIISAFADQPSMPTTADFEAVLALGGGWKYAAVTEEQCEQAWQDDLANGIIKSCINSLKTVRDAAGTKLNNAIASLSAEHVDGLTLEQLQARCDAVMASNDGVIES